MANGLALIGVALLLVIINGFFVAAEFALVKLRQTRVKALAKRTGWRGSILLKVHGDLDAYLSACQLGITLASLGLGWIGEPAFAQLLKPGLNAIGIESDRAVHAIAFTVAFSIISYLHIVVGEQAPKSMAIRVSDQVALWTAVPLWIFYWVMYPAIWGLNTSATWVLRKVGLDTATHGHESHYSSEELKLILRSGRADSNFTADEWRVLAQAIDFRDLEVSDLMRPFNEVVTLSADDTVEANLDRIAEHRYSRYPYLDRRGRVQGVIHVKDLFLAQRHGGVPMSLGKLVRPVLTVRPDLPAIELFRRFSAGASHFAVIAFEDERPLGFITLDNLLGALVGEIRDEFRQTENEWTTLEDGSLIGKGSLPIFTLERVLGIDIEESEVGSVGGLIYQQLGAVPVEGQRISFDRFEVEITSMEGPRIAEMRILPKEESAPA
ncbi:MAG TPA: hemolysin family protein [Pseudomonadales bacterium]